MSQKLSRAIQTWLDRNLQLSDAAYANEATRMLEEVKAALNTGQLTQYLKELL